MNNNKYTPVIGLEVHVELNTKSKMFCGCDNDWFGKTPNTHTCPVCLGLPGALPVPNKKAIEGCIKIGMALGCTIPLLSKFDRKNYFYPDLAKGYQISQYDQPFAEHGSITLSSGKKVGITRAHMEEDTGKLMHALVDGKKVSLIDFNRSGSPLVEIVTEPDFESAAEVKEYLQYLQQIVRYLGVANGDMEKGGMRLEPNISLRVTPSDSSLSPLGEGQGEGRSFELPKYKVEVKNINSFSFVEKAIEYEIKRHIEILEKGEIPAQETRGWDEDKNITISQRSKEEAADYRYFPEPDIPPFIWTKEYLDKLRSQIPELPNEKRERFINEFKLSEYNAGLLTRSVELASYFEECVSLCHPEQSEGSQSKNRDSTSLPQNDITPTQIANTILNKKVDIEKILPAKLVEIIVKETRIDPMNEAVVMEILQKVIRENQNVVSDYKTGKTSAIMYLIGQSMKELRGREKAEKVKETLEKLLA